MGSGDSHSDVIIIGAGIIGLSAAWRLAQRGQQVTVVDPAPLHAASHAAAGMLAPVSEVTYGEAVPLRLARESLSRYPAFVQELQAATGSDVGLRQHGTLIVVTDYHEIEVLNDLHVFQTSLGLTANRLTSRVARHLEPQLTPRIRGAVEVAGDLSVDNRRLGAALLEAGKRLAVTVVEESVSELVSTSTAVSGVRLSDGTTIHADTTVVAAGAWSNLLPGMPDGARPPVRPVKGQILRLHAPTELLPGRSIRGFVHGREIYLVPRSDGELVIGATVEDRGFDTTVTAGAVRELLDDARAVLPAIDEMQLVESFAALRPGTPDNVPVIGRATIAGLVIATGHYRNGILLSPLTADLVASIVTDGTTDREWGALTDPRRFAKVAA